ncbi:MAG: hypothetical protein Q4D20_08595 [Clostridia bacterium]|nr:hypothetical protein [Clostridia bacterium]
MNKKLYLYKSEYCVMCGKEIPEGNQVCRDCEERLSFSSFEEEFPNAEPSFFGRIFKKKTKG